MTKKYSLKCCHYEKNNNNYYYKQQKQKQQKQQQPIVRFDLAIEDSETFKIFSNLATNQIRRL